MPLNSSREKLVKDKRKSHGYLPYDQDGRRAKMATLRSWSPSIWNALTFWKSDGVPNEEDEENEQDASIGPTSGPSSLENTSAVNSTNGSPNSSTDSESNPEGHLNDSSFASNLSEEQVSSHLMLQPPRHVHFEPPSISGELLNSGYPQPIQVNQQPIPATPVKQNQLDIYVAPVPPSSPLRRLDTPQEDPLTQVAEYIANRDGRRPLHHVEALGLNTLIQQSVYAAGLPTAARYHGSQHPNSISAPSGLPASPVSTTPSPIRPTFTTPTTDITTLLTASSAPSTSLQSVSSVSQISSSRSSPSSSRTLARNPNGMLHYEGGGSARSRYRSSAFSDSPARKKMSFPRGFGDSSRTNGPARMADTPSPSDGKRRRVGEERHSSTAQASGSTPAMNNGTGSATKAPVMPPATGPTSLRFGISSSGSRLLANTPARPSPLRQSVRADSSSPSSASPGSVNDGSPRARIAGIESPSRARASEKASEIMAGIINDATPKKDEVPDLRNPYQANNRSPTKRSRKPVTKASRPPPRPSRSTGPPAPPQAKKLSALETIQRTAPQAQTGSKRSHTGMPPMEPKAPATNGVRAPSDSGVGKPGSSMERPLVIEIDEDEEEQSKPPPTKKKRQEVEEAGEKEKKTLDDDVDMDDPSSPKMEKGARPSEIVESDAERQNSPESNRLVFAGPFGKKAPTARFQSVPKEPSPLRQSFQPDVPSSPPTDLSSASNVSPSAPASTTFTFAPKSVSPLAQSSALSNSAPPPAPSTAPPRNLTPFFSTSSPPTDLIAAAKKQALDVPVDALPIFAFAVTRGTVVLDGEKSHRDAALAVPVHELPKFDFSVVPAPKPQIMAFDFKAAGMKPIIKSGWTCGTCMITNDINATKCISCESTR